MNTDPVGYAIDELSNMVNESNNVFCDMRDILGGYNSPMGEESIQHTMGLIAESLASISKAMTKIVNGECKLHCAFTSGGLVLQFKSGGLL